MTPAELKTLLDNIVTEVNGVASFGQVLAPKYASWIAIGKAVDTMIPGLVEGVDNWVQGNPATDAEKADLLQKLSVLGDPNAP